MLVPDCKYNYMNDSLVNYLRYNFVDHGTTMVSRIGLSELSHIIGQKLIT